MLGTAAVTPQLAVSIAIVPLFLLFGRLKPQWPDAVVGLYLLSVFISMWGTAPTGTVIEAYGRTLLLGLAPYLVGRYLGLNPDLMRRGLGLLITIMAVLGVFVVIESVARFNIHSLVWQVPYRPHPDIRLGFTRAHAWTSHPIMMGVAYAAVLPVAVVAALERIKLTGSLRWSKAFLIALGVFFSLSSGSWLPALCGLALVLWDQLRFLTPAMRWALMGAGAPLTYVLLEFASGRPLLRILMMKLHLSSPMAWYYRWRLFERVQDMMPGKWMFGWGLGVRDGFSIDNHYLAVLLMYGRSGLVLWIAMIVAVVLNGWNTLWKAPDTKFVRFGRAVMFAVVGIALTQLSVAMFSTGAALNWMMMGLGVGIVQFLRLHPQAMKKAKPGVKASRGARKRVGRAPRQATHGLARA